MLFLGDLERIYPGAVALAPRSRSGKILAHWNIGLQTLAHGSYAVIDRTVQAIVVTKANR
jgi:hypothetical protein